MNEQLWNALLLLHQKLLSNDEPIHYCLIQFGVANKVLINQTFEKEQEDTKCIQINFEAKPILSTK